jgi:hypothetical protein
MPTHDPQISTMAQYGFGSTTAPAACVGAFRLWVEAAASNDVPLCQPSPTSRARVLGRWHSHIKSTWIDLDCTETPCDRLRDSVLEQRYPYLSPC